ncbi:MAG: hypothetical protein DRJ34_01515 [Thermoprotei archaeon]|nr:MAG: hypothetical protein DRJ34_01515 [Thermoprotei archaeon]
MSWRRSNWWNIVDGRREHIVNLIMLEKEIEDMSTDEIRKLINYLEEKERTIDENIILNLLKNELNEREREEK